MPQQAADFGKSGAVPKHIGGKCMSKLVRTASGRINACTLDGDVDDRGYRLLRTKVSNAW